MLATCCSRGAAANLPTYAQNVATSHGLSSSISSNVPIAIYGVVLILVMLLFPSGIQGAIRRLLPELEKCLDRKAGVLRVTPLADLRTIASAPRGRLPDSTRARCPIKWPVRLGTLTAHSTSN